MTTLQVATFNIRTGRAYDGRNSWPLRRASTALMIKSLDVDVIGIQEALGFQLGWIRSQMPQYTASGRGRSSKMTGEHCAVLTKNESTKLISSNTVWYGSSPERPGSRMPSSRFPRIATIAQIELLETGQEVQIVNTHLDERNNANRRRSIEQLVDWLDPLLPKVVLGDMNATLDDRELSPLVEAGLQSVLDRDAGGTTHRFTGRSDGPQIDHIFISNEFEVADAGIVREMPHHKLPSDHWPVTAKLLIRS